MNFKANSAVRLRMDSRLLFIDWIDNDTTTAYCRRFGDEGPEGESEPYALDCLRENVIRAPRPVDPQAHLSSLRKALCWISLHAWETRIFHGRPLIGSIESRVCSHCGEIRLRR